MWGSNNMATKQKQLEAKIRSAARQHFGSEVFFDESKMLAVFVKRGYSQKAVEQAIISVQANRLQTIQGK